jgi:Spy/CpxP family protein refolding chaperone
MIAARHAATSTAIARRAPRLLAAASLLAALSAGWTAAAHAAPPAGFAPASMQGGPGTMGPHGGPGAMGPHGGPGGLPLGGRMLERMLDDVAATAEQRAQIRAIAEAAAADLRTLAEAQRGARQQALQLFAQPQLDAAAVEAQRQKMLQDHDAMSRRVTQAMLDVGRTLTPEQRVRLVERIGQRRDPMQRHPREQRPADGAPRGS